MEFRRAAVRCDVKRFDLRYIKRLLATVWGHLGLGRPGFGLGLRGPGRGERATALAVLGRRARLAVPCSRAGQAARQKQLLQIAFAGLRRRYRKSFQMVQIKYGMGGIYRLTAVG